MIKLTKTRCKNAVIELGLDLCIKHLKYEQKRKTS